MAKRITMDLMPPEAALDFEATAPETVTMRPTVTCWLDLLGFRDRLATSSKDESAFVADYLRVLQPIYRNLRWDFDDDSFCWNAFTDTIILSAPADEAHPEFVIGNIVMAASEIQFRLAVRGWFLRGAIAYGPLWRSQEFVVGSGLMKAYKLEGDEAVWPRVIVDDTIRGLVLTFLSYYAAPTNSPHNSAFARAEDGHVFLNYLSTPMALDADETSVDRFLGRHRGSVMHQLSIHSVVGRLRSKYLWVAAYHNWFCQTWLPASSAAALRIDGIPPRGFARLT